MEIHWGCSESVDVEIAFCSRAFLFTKKHPLCNLHAPYFRISRSGLPRYPFLMLVFLSRILTLTPLVCFGLEQVFLCLLRLLAYHHEEHLFAINQLDHEKTIDLDEEFTHSQSWLPIRRDQASSYSAQQKVFVVLQTLHGPVLRGYSLRAHRLRDHAAPSALRAIHHQKHPGRQ